MAIGHRDESTQTGVVAAGTGFALLAALAAASRKERSELPEELADALARIGDEKGETWLNLLGVALDAGPPYDADHLAREIRSLDPLELRRHLLGRFAWSWCTLAGIDGIESAAAGDAEAGRRLLEHPRYYGGHAATSLGVLLPLGADETRDRILRAVDAGAGALLDATTKETIDAAAQTAATAIAEQPLLAAVELVATGYRYVPELEAERVVLIPHVEPSLPLVLAQHRASRLIAYCVTADRGSEDRLVEVGRALADPKRVEILALVGHGIGRSSLLVDATGLSRSTVHHHLSQLREAGLIALEGNARSYTYVPHHDAATHVATLVADVVGTKEEG